MRIGGLASGMDIEMLVKKLITAEKAPLDKLRQKKQVLEWQRDEYRAINTLLLDFRTELTNMKMTSKYRARTTTSSNDAFLTAIANSAASQSSFSMSKVTQLATTERILSSDKEKINLVSGSSLYEQSKGSMTWNIGSVESQTLKADGVQNEFSLKVDPSVTVKDQSTWSVKVNGKGYKVITGPTKPDNLDNSSVYIDNTGKLYFNNAPAKDSSIRVDYIADKRTDKLNLTYNTTSLQLGKGSINTIQQIKLNRVIKNTAGEITETKAEVLFQVDAQGNVLEGGTKIGTLDKNTGKITFVENGLKGEYLPPEKPAEGQVYDYNFEITYDQNYTTFSLDTVTSKGDMHENFIVQGNETISSLSARVNGSSVGVSMFYDEGSGQMSLSRAETGKFNKSANDISFKGTLVTNIFKFNSDQTVTWGENAKFNLNGIEMERSSNTFTVDGVTFTLKQTFGAAGTSDPSASPITLNVNNDSTQVFDNIVQFVNKYNELIDKIQKKTGEERYRTYLPLTDEQREAMSDKQQEMWDGKAKSGLLRRDPILTNFLSEMRMDFYQPVMNDDVSSMFSQLAQLGITTGANYLDGGKLTIDEAKLKKAIEDDPQSVENFFIGTGTTEGQKGVINRLYDTVTQSMDKLRRKAGNSYSTNQTFSIGLELDTIGDRILRFEDRLKQVENRYWSQFTAMEKAIQRANEQSAYLMQMFGG